MRITLNGRPTETTAATVADLLVADGAPRSGTAVAVNGEVVPRARQAGHDLAEGDVVDVVTAVQGG